MKVIKNNFAKSDLLKNVFCESELDIVVTTRKKDGSATKFNVPQLVVGSIDIMNGDDTFTLDIYKTIGTDGGVEFKCELDNEIFSYNLDSELTFGTFNDPNTTVEIGLNSEDLNEDFQDVVFTLAVSHEQFGEMLVLEFEGIHSI